MIPTDETDAHRHRYYTSFAKTVARGWSVPIAQARMGRGRVLGADADLARGRVDDVATLPEGISKVRGDA